MKKKKKQKIDTSELTELDENLLLYMQPQGGITFKDPSYILTGDGYVKCIHIYKMPSLIDDFWLSKICNIDGTIATVDIFTRDKNEVKKNINKSLKEEFARQSMASDWQSYYDATMRQTELQEMYNEITSMGEVVKMVYFRIFVPNRSLASLEEKVDKIIADLEADDYRAAIFLSEGERDYKSLLSSYSKQRQELFMLKGHTLMSEQLAGGNPFSYSSLNDPHGNFLGFTPCGGPVVFDMFAKTETRNYAHSLVIGKQRFGKSTFLKKQFRVRAERGDFIRCFDPTGEYSNITREFGGRILYDDEILNPLEILRADETDKFNFARHMTKLATFFKCINEEANVSLLNDFEEVLKDFYRTYNLLPEMQKSITGLPAESYPIFSDLEAFVTKRIEEIVQKNAQGMEKTLEERELLALREIEKTVNKIINSYGYIFNGHTTINNITDEQIVTINISKIKTLDKSIFTAYLFNMNSLCWDNCVANGMIMKEKHEKGEVSYEEATKFEIIIDESHLWINASMPMIVDLISKFLREAPKFFGSIIMASHSIRDFFPEGSASDKGIAMMKTLFELTQYKFLFLQDSVAVPMLDSVFGAALTSSQRDIVTKLQRGECVLVISGDRNLQLKVWLSDAENELFTGGN